MDNHKRNLLAADMHRNVLPLMYDSARKRENTNDKNKSLLDL